MPSYLEPIDAMASLDSYHRSTARQRQINNQDQEQARTRERENAQQSYADHYGRGDYAGAGVVAAKTGDVEGIEAARGAQREHTEQEQLEGWRILNQYGGELDQITESQDNEGYAAWLARAREQAQTSPELAAEVARWPETFDPGMARRLSGVIRTWRDRILSPAQVAEMEATNRRLDIQERGADTAERRAAAAERTAEAAMLRAERGGSGGTQWRTMSGDEVAEAGLPAGTVAQVSNDGQIRTVRGQRQYSDAASLSAQFADRMTGANRTLMRLEDAGVDPNRVYAFGGGDPNAQAYRQAQREFINSILRRESGAAIAESEFDSARQQYFPLPNDPPAVREQKRQARARAIQGLINASQGAYQEWYGEGGGAAAAPSAPNPRAPAAGASPQRPPSVPADYVWNAQDQTWDPPN